MLTERSLKPGCSRGMICLVMLLMGSGCHEPAVSVDSPAPEAPKPSSATATQSSSAIPSQAAVPKPSSAPMTIAATGDRPPVRFPSGMRDLKDPGEETPLTGLFQKGLLEEETSLDLDGAIGHYEEVLARWDKDRPTAASAAFRLGECYRRQGETNQAIHYYQRVVAEFPGQPDLVQLSRRQLAAIGVTLSETVGLTPENGTVKVMDAASRQRQEDLLREQIRIVEQQLEDHRRRSEVGAAQPSARLPLQRDLLHLRFRIESLGPVTAESNKRRQTLLEEQIHIVQEQLKVVDAMIRAGRAGLWDSFSLQRELVELKLRRETLGAEAPQAFKGGEEPSPANHEGEEKR